MTEVAQRSRNAVVSPKWILAGHLDGQFYDLASHTGPSRILTILRAVELLSDQPAIPREDRFGFRDTSHLLQDPTSKPLANFCQRRPFRISETKPLGQVGPQDPDFYRTVPMVFNPNINSDLSIVTRNIPGGSVSMGPGYLVSNTTQFDPTVPLEFSQLRRYDEAARKRYDGKAALDVPFGDKVSLSLSYRYTRDNYGKGFYGLQHDLNASVDSEVTFAAGERTFLYVDYSRQFEGYRDLGLGHLICGGNPMNCVTGAPANVNACCAIYPIRNTWDRSSRSSLDTVQTGINWASKGENVIVDLSYGYSYSKDRIHTFNPFPILPFSLLTAGSYNYPDTRNRFQEVLFSGTRKIRPGLDVGVHYRFQAYALDDFFLNNLQPYSQGLIVTGGIPSNLPRQLFLNARFGTYHAHEEGAFLRYSF